MKDLVWRRFYYQNRKLWTYVISNLNGGEIFGTFYEKELQKTRSNLKLKGWLRKMLIDCTKNGNIKMIALIVGLIGKT